MLPTLTASLLAPSLSLLLLLPLPLPLSLSLRRQEPLRPSLRFPLPLRVPPALSPPPSLALLFTFAFASAFAPAPAPALALALAAAVPFTLRTISTAGTACAPPPALSSALPSACPSSAATAGRGYEKGVTSQPTRGKCRNKACVYTPIPSSRPPFRSGSIMVVPRPTCSSLTRDTSSAACRPARSASGLRSHW
jgi:hypothetical protein